MSPRVEHAMSPRVEHAMSPRVEHAMSPRVEHAMSPRVAQATLWLPLLLAFWAGAAVAQQLDFSHGGPVDVTARDGIEWHQNEQEIIANGDARATRDNVTVTADQLIAHYRKKAASAITPASAPSATGPAQPDGAGADDAGSNEIYRLEAVGNVHIFSATDQAWGDHAVYDMDQSVLVMTGHALRLVTPTDVMTARDSMEYWSVPRRSVARGNALVLTTDGRRISADTLVGYSEDPNAHPAGAAGASKIGFWRRPAGRHGKAATGGSLRQCAGPHGDRDGLCRSRRLCAGYRHRPRGRSCARDPRTEPNQRGSSGREHENRYFDHALWTGTAGGGVDRAK